MARGRGHTQTAAQTAGRGRRTRGGVRKTARTRRTGRRNEQPSEEATSLAGSIESATLESEGEADNQNEAVNPSEPERQTEPSSLSPTPPYNTPQTDSVQSAITIHPRRPSTRQSSSSPGNDGITIDDMRELLRSHEEDLITRVIARLRSENRTNYNANQAQPLQSAIPRVDHTPIDPTRLKIRELEEQIRQLRSGQDPSDPAPQRLPELGMYNLILPPTTVAIESANAGAESIESLFPGVERSTLTQIIENPFKPTNIYRLLASEKERAETKRTIMIGGVEFEQAEQDGKEKDYRMGNFFKAWAANSGILVKLAPYGLQGDLATALFIYTMNLYDLLERYTWEGVKSYHFQYHRKRVASGTSIYLPSEWRQIDSELIASKCFAHPIIRTTWQPSNTRIQAPHERITELPLRGYPSSSPQLENWPGIGHTPTQTRMQVCRNWNYRDCRNSSCRYPHSCALCGSSHKATQCQQGDSALSTSVRTTLPRS